MAVYKVIQDVEAEDKLVGPLTFKQFVYAIIAAVCIFINFKLIITTNLGVLRWVFVAGFSIPMILFAVLASPIGGDQPTELWLLSHLKFMFKPKQRTWDQEGIIETVTITAPKKTNTALTKNLSQGEVQSRLKALATMLDSRGWAVQTTPFYQSPNAEGVEADDDRLVGADALPQTTPDVDVRAGDDILDEQASATAQRYGALVKEVEEQKKQAIAERLKHPEAKAESKQTPAKEVWGVQNIGPVAVINPDVPSSFDITPPEQIQPLPQEVDQNLESRLKEAEATLHAQRHYDDTSPLAAERKRREQRRILEHSQGAMANLASSDNFSVSTIASLANRGSNEQLIRSMPF